MKDISDPVVKFKAKLLYGACNYKGKWGFVLKFIYFLLRIG